MGWDRWKSRAQTEVWERWDLVPMGGAVRETLSSSGGKSLRDRLKQGWRGKVSQQLQCLLCNAEAGVWIPKFLGMLAIPAPEGRHRGAPQLGRAQE